MSDMPEKPCTMCMRGSGFDRCSYSTCPMRKQITAHVGYGTQGVFTKGTQNECSTGTFRKIPTCRD